MHSKRQKRTAERADLQKELEELFNRQNKGPGVHIDTCNFPAGDGGGLK